MSAFIGAATAVTQIFIIIGLGWLLANPWKGLIGNPGKEFWGFLAKFVYSASLPILTIGIFMDFVWRPEHINFVLASVGISLLVVVLGVATTPLFRLEREQKYTAMAIGYHPNSIFLGFPLIISLLGMEYLPLAALFAVIEFPILIAASILILNKGKGSEKASEKAFGGILKVPLKDPVIWGCLIGILLSASGFSMPAIFRLPIGWMGSMASPLALIVIGSRLNLGKVHHYRKAIAAISFQKLLLGPAAGLMVTSALGLVGKEQAVLILEIATPVAVSSILLVEQHYGDRELSANAISATTLFSMLTLCGLATWII